MVLIYLQITNIIFPYWYGIWYLLGGTGKYETVLFFCVLFVIMGALRLDFVFLG